MIEETLTSIKEYFLHWHNDEENYEENHLKTNLLTKTTTPDKDYPITSAAVQIALDNQKTEITDKLDSMDQMAQGGTVDYTTAYNSKTKGFHTMVSGNKQPGFMSWEDKVQLKGLGMWKQITSSTSKSGLNGSMTMYVNPGIRLVYFNFTQENFSSLSGRKNFEWRKNVTYTTLLRKLSPKHTIWGATNQPNIVMGIDTYGKFYLRSTDTIAGAVDINGSLMWYYGGDDIYNNIKTEQQEEEPE